VSLSSFENAGFSDFGGNQSAPSDGASEQELFSWFTVTATRLRITSFQGITQWQLVQQPNVGHFTCSAGDASRTRFVNAQITQPLLRTFQSLPAVFDQPFLAGCFALGPVTSDVRLVKEGTVPASNWMGDQLCSERPTLGPHAVLMQCNRLRQAAGGAYNCLVASEKPNTNTNSQRFTVSVISVSSVQSPLSAVLSSPLLSQ
jgi:hypothetical protein